MERIYSISNGEDSNSSFMGTDLAMVLSDLDFFKP